MAPVGDVALPAGIFNVGPLLPAGLRFSEFEQDFGDASVTFAQFVGPVETRPLNFITAIPEPGSCSLLLLAGLGIAARRNRR